MNALIFLLLSVFLFFVMRMRTVFVFLLGLTIVFLLKSGVFIVYEGSQVVLTQFGQIINQPYREAGLYFKVPFLWKANYFDKRIYTDTDYQANIPTRDKYFISVDTVVNWRIADPATFFTVMDNSNDEIRVILRNIVSGSVREIISKYDLIETLQVKKGEAPPMTLLQDFVTKPDKMDDNYHNPVFYGRVRLVNEMRSNIKKYMNDFGIDVVKVLITDIRYSDEVEKRVYDRMIQQRLRMAARLRSMGLKDFHKIMGELHKDYQSIIAPAQKEALLIRGTAEAQVTEIYANAYGQSSKFYNYWRTLRAYNEGIPAMSKGAFLSTDSAFLKLLQKRSKIMEAAPVAKPTSSLTSPTKKKKPIKKKRS